MKQYKTPRIQNDISETPIVPLLAAAAAGVAAGVALGLTKKAHIRQMPEKNLSSVQREVK